MDCYLRDPTNCANAYTGLHAFLSTSSSYAKPFYYLYVDEDVDAGYTENFCLRCTTADGLIYADRQFTVTQTPCLLTMNPRTISPRIFAYDKSGSQ